MDIQTVLADLGARDFALTPQEKSRLDMDGYLPLHGILAAAEVEAFNQRLAEITAAEGERAGAENWQEAGTDRLSDLINKDPIFTVCFTHPRLLAAVHHVLPGEFKLSSLNSRSALPGWGHQGLHSDFAEAVPPDDYLACNSFWLLDDFTPDNGATRVVPGSHRFGQMPREVMADPTAPHPDEVQVIEPVGTVVVMNAHLWHAGTLNRSSKPRRVMHSYFCHRSVPQQLDQQAYVRPDTLGRLSPAERYLLDVTDSEPIAIV